MPPKLDTVADIKGYLKQLNIKFDSKGNKKYLLSLVPEDSQKPPSPDEVVPSKRKPVDVPDKVQSKRTPKADVPVKVTPKVAGGQRVIALKCFSRLFIVVQDTEETEYDVDCYGHLGNAKLSLPTCRNFVFEKSTGKSNVFNFKSVCLPFLRQDKSGWIHKDGNLDKKSHILSSLINYISPKMRGEHLKCQSDIKSFLKEFINRFGCWRQLQLSAALAQPGELWIIVPVARYLREFALTYNWCNPIDLDIERDQKKLDAYIEGNPEFDLDVSDLKKKYGTTNMIVNMITILKNRIKANMVRMPEIRSTREFIQNLAESGRILDVADVEGGFFYKRNTDMRPIIYDPIVCNNIETVKDWMEVNVWLRDNGALCKEKDAPTEKGSSKSEKSESKSEKSESAAANLSDGEKFSGWWVC